MFAQVPGLKPGQPIAENNLSFGAKFQMVIPILFIKRS